MSSLFVSLCCGGGGGGGGGVVVVVVEVLLYVHRNRRLIRDGSPGGDLDFRTAPEL